MSETVLIDYDEIAHDTGDGGATLFHIENREVWVPNSVLVDVWENDNQFEVPEWFALQEELI